MLFNGSVAPETRDLTFGLTIRRTIGMLNLEAGELFEAGDGAEAIERMNGPVKIDLVLADLNMPKMPV